MLVKLRYLNNGKIEIILPSGSAITTDNFIYCLQVLAVKKVRIIAVLYQTPNTPC